MTRHALPVKESSRPAFAPSGKLLTARRCPLRRGMNAVRGMDGCDASVGQTSAPEANGAPERVTPKLELIND